MTDSIGNQLQSRSDVKIRGLIVGEVRSISTVGHGARIELALQPARGPQHPGQRLGPAAAQDAVRRAVRRAGARRADRPAPGRSPRGDVIPQDRSSSAIELEQVFDDLLPLLQAVQPAKLSATLNAMATALDGRGEQLGQNLVALDAYLKGLNPHLPTLTSDIRRLTSVATTYAAGRARPADDGAQPVDDRRTRWSPSRTRSGRSCAASPAWRRPATSVLQQDGRPDHPGRPGQPADAGRPWRATRPSSPA